MSKRVQELGFMSKHLLDTLGHRWTQNGAKTERNEDVRY